MVVVVVVGEEGGIRGQFLLLVETWEYHAVFDFEVHEVLRRFWVGSGLDLLRES